MEEREVDGANMLRILTNKVYNAAIELFRIQFMHALLTALIVIVAIIFLFWFEPLGFWISGVFLLGVLVNTLLAFITV